MATGVLVQAGVQVIKTTGETDAEIQARNTADYESASKLNRQGRLSPLETHPAPTLDKSSAMAD